MYPQPLLVAIAAPLRAWHSFRMEHDLLLGKTGNSSGSLPPSCSKWNLGDVSGSRRASTFYLKPGPVSPEDAEL